MEDKYEHLTRLLESDIDLFEGGLRHLDRQDLVRVVGLLQQSMQEEQLRFYQLNERLKAEQNSDAKNYLSDELCLSQSRMAQLCAKNMKCYEQPNLPLISGGGHPYLPVEQRKSLSSLYKEKQAKETPNGSTNNNSSKSFPNPTSFITDINGNTETADSSSNNIRNAFQTVLTDILGREVDIDSGNKQEKTVDDEKKPTKQLSRSYAVDYSNNYHHNTLSFPVKVTNAAKPSELELQESRRRILDQVKRSRQGGKENFKSSSIDTQPFPNLNFDKKPLRSILKKKSMSTSEPNLNGDLTLTSPTTTTAAERRLSEIERTTEIVTKTSIELKRPPSIETGDKTIISVKLHPVKSPGFISLRPNVGFHQQEIVDNKSSQITMESVRRDLPDVVNDPTTKTVHEEPRKLQSPISSTSPRARTGSYHENGHDKFYHHVEHDDYRDWDPRNLLETLYDIDYTPKAEMKKRKFVNMEGHLEHLPLGLRVAVVDNLWRTHYFKTKDGRLLWFENPDTDIIPFGDVILAGTDLDVDKNECTLLIHGGKEGTLLKLKCPSHLLDKWRQALLSHGSATIEDTFVKPVYPPIANPSDCVCVIELGSCSIRAGVLTAEPSLPKVFFPTIATVLDNKEVIVGKEALAPEVRHKGTFVQPIKPTNPTSSNRYNLDLNTITHVFQKVFDDLEIKSEDYEIMISVPQNAPINMISELMKILLHEFNVRGVAVAKQPYLILYSYDVTTGVVVDLGDHLNIVTVIDGYIVQNAVISLPYGGFKIADVLRSKLTEQNPGVYTFMSPVERYILRYIMEQTCYVAEDFDEEIENYERSPDSVDTVVKMGRFDIRSEALNEFNVDSTRFTCTEGLFKPKRWSLDVDGLQKLIYHAIQSAPMDSRRLLYKNIYLAGGASLLPGLPQRLESELTKLAPSSVQVCIRTSPWRYHSAYIGAQILAGSSQFEQTLITSKNLDSFIRQMHSANF